MRISMVLAAIAISTVAYADDAAKPDICSKDGELTARVKTYEQCIAGYAKKYEITGDAAESVATAAVSACGSFRIPIVEFLNQCFHASGNEIADSEQQKFHDFGVQAVIQ